MTRRPNGTGGITKAGYIHIQTKGMFKYEHVIVAEKAIGGPLPAGAIVHHVDENTQNNANSNLVICPDAKYHRLLHRRAAAFNACGHADYLICRHCHVYDAPANLIIDGSRSMAHRECRSAYRRKIYNERKVNKP